jgi:hypothetical protein
MSHVVALPQSLGLGFVHIPSEQAADDIQIKATGQELTFVAAR